MWGFCDGGDRKRESLGCIPLLLYLIKKLNYKMTPKTGLRINLITVTQEI